jgi:hypothetical protein
LLLEFDRKINDEDKKVGSVDEPALEPILRAFLMKQ